MADENDIIGSASEFIKGKKIHVKWYIMTIEAVIHLKLNISL